LRSGYVPEQQSTGNLQALRGRPVAKPRGPEQLQKLWSWNVPKSECANFVYILWSWHLPKQCREVFVPELRPRRLSGSNRPLGLQKLSGWQSRAQIGFTKMPRRLCVRPLLPGPQRIQQSRGLRRRLLLPDRDDRKTPNHDRVPGNACFRQPNSVLWTKNMPVWIRM